MSLRSITTATPDGDFHLIINHEGTALAAGFGELRELAKRLPDELQSVAVEAVQHHEYQASIAAYFEGDASALDTIPRSQDGSDFQKKVWTAISAVPHGKTISYKQLAEASGRPAAFRAAGTICGLNRLILLVPCHRVLKSDGGIGSYLYGAAIKESLLAREKA